MKRRNFFNMLLGLIPLAWLPFIKKNERIHTTNGLIDFINNSKNTTSLNWSAGMSEKEFDDWLIDPIANEYDTREEPTTGWMGRKLANSLGVSKDINKIVTEKCIFHIIG